MSKNMNWLAISLSVVAALLLLVAGILGYMYWRDQSNKKTTQDSNTSSDNGNSTGTDSSTSGSSDGTGNTNTGGEPATKPSVPATKKIVCSNWVYNVPGKTSPILYITYDDSDNVTFKNVNPECVDIEMHYKEATLYLTYSYGEAQSVAFPSGTEVLSLKTGKTPYGNTATLARQKFTVTKKDSKGVTSYWLNYVSLQSKTDCNTFDPMAGKVLGYPCYTGANPFVTPAGRFDLSITKGTSSDEIVKLSTYFDAVAKNSYFVAAK